MAVVIRVLVTSSIAQQTAVTTFQILLFRLAILKQPDLHST